MACEYCLHNKLPDDFTYCPKCGEHTRVTAGLRKLKALADIAKAVVLSQYSDVIRDENGDLMVTDRKPWDSPIGIIKFDPDSVDISAELALLQAQALLNKEDDDA